jgi:hypothetical protein
MKTDDLIAALSADATVESPLAPRLAGLAALSAALVAALFYAVFAPRPDLLAAAAATAMKLAFTLSLAAAGLAAALRLARPGERRASLAWLAAPLALLAAFVAADLARRGLVGWRPRLFGATAAACFFLVTTLAALPLAALLRALRRGAPERPARAGFAAGLAAAGLGASVYALHCPEDSPLFMAAWYGAAALAAGLIGAALGRRLLRW